MFSQVMTLYITPVVYTYMEHLQQWTRRKFRKKDARPERRFEEREEMLTTSHD